MKKAYFVDSSAYVAYAKNEFWTITLAGGDLYTPKTIIDEVNALTNPNSGKVKLGNFERKRLDDLISSTNVVSNREISDEVYDAHKRSIVQRQIKNPNTIMGERDIELVEVANNFSKLNSDLDVLLFTGDVTMASSVPLIIGSNLKVIEPFSKALFNGTKGIKPHFVLEEAVSDLSSLIENEEDYIFGNVFLKDNIGYIHSFSPNESERDRFNKSYLVNTSQITADNSERMVRMYKSGGVFPIVDGFNLELNILKKEPTKKQVELVRSRLSKGKMNLQLYNQTVMGIVKEFRKGMDSIAYTITGDQLKNVAGKSFYENLYHKRSNILK